MASSSGCVREEVAQSLPDAVERVERVCRSEALGTDQRFPRFCRLTARRQFLEVYQRGRKAQRPCFAVFGIPNDVGHCRVGLTVTRKVGCAVARNRIKRVLRDVFRRHRMELQPPMDIVINGYRSMLSLPSDQIERQLLDAVAELARKVAR